MRIETEHDLQTALTALSTQCEHMARVLGEIGPPPLRRRAPGFEGLAQIVVFQQISTDAGRAIWAKVERVFGAVTPEAFLGATDDDMRAAGLSRPKMRTMRAIAEAVATGVLDLDGLEHRSAEEAVAAMIKVKGIGPWTADIYLLSCLGHTDAWPAGDLALQIGAADVLGLSVRPNVKEMGPLAERWRPYRAVAARLLWAHYGAKRAAKNAEPV